MKKLILGIFLIATVLTASSQKVYFLYIQSESQQPFYVKLNGKIQSSTNAGYLILSKLIDSTYNFSIGFPQSKFPEQDFSVVINKKDHGFLLKQFGEKGWGLYNLQTLNILMASNASAKVNSPAKTDNKSASEFTEILSKVADDPTIKEKPVQPKVEEKKKVDVVAKVEEKKEPIVAVVEKTEAKQVVEEKKPEKPAQIIENKVEQKLESKADVEVIENLRPEPKKSTYESYTPSTVKRWSESSTTDGFGLVFIDNYENGAKDTIRLLIPNPKQIEVPVATNEAAKEEKKFIEIENNNDKKKEETKLTEVKPVVENQIDKLPLSNNCTIVANEDDFFKLRKQMVIRESNEDMVEEAKAYFKTKCFTSEQIKNIGSLFLTDQSKYKFFDVAYNYVSDAKNFPELQNELKDEYYINRFKAMLRN